MHRITFAAVSLTVSLLALPCAAQVESRPATPIAPAAPTAPKAVAKPAAPAEKKPVYDESADGKKQIAEALAQAKKENRRVLIQWGANWCGWCIKLHETYKTNRDLARKLMYEYDVVLIDIGKWDKHLDIAEQYGADFKNQGVPYLTILDSDGNVLANQDTGSLEAAEQVKGKPSHDVEKLMAFLTEHQAPYRSADSVLSDALAKAKEEHKTVLLHFGAPWCGWCHKFEAWLAVPEVEEVLAKDFVEVKIDVDRTLGGKDMHKHYAQRENTGIPWFALLDSDGETLSTSDGPNGNIGCPVQDEELAHFRTMLNAAAKHLSEDDIKKITAKLQDKDEKAAAAGH